MNKSKIRAISLLLTVVMVFSALLTACTGGGDTETTGGIAGESTESTAPDKDNTESEGGENESESESNTDEDDSGNDIVGPSVTIDGDFGTSILEADKLKGGVKAYFTNGLRNTLLVENQSVVLNIGLSKADDGVVTVTSHKGGTFLENTVDSYIKTADGKYYYASNSVGYSDTNIYRMGYYMYDVHVYGADFFPEGDAVENEKSLPVSLFSHTAMADIIESEKNVFAYKVTDAADPRAYMKLNLAADNVKYLTFSMKNEASGTGQIFIRTDSMSEFSSAMSVSFDVIGDGEYHDYVLNLNNLPDLKGRITYIRFDVGFAADEVVEIKDVASFNVSGDLPAARLDRSFYVYSDKINQVMHLIAPADSENVNEYGYEIKIPADKVNKLIVSDRYGEHDNIDAIHWATSKYIAFDIDGVGVFGFIMINDRDYAGRYKVTLEDGNYVLRHYANPMNGEILEGEELYLGNRLYFGDSHDFSEFLFEAYCEANPLTDITVTTQGSSPMGRYFGYDGLRGAYKYDVRYGNWNDIYFNAQNKHYNVLTTINGDELDRKIYIYTSAIANGQTLECAVLMDENEVLIPIPLEVCKNFAGDGEANEFLADEGYSEVYFPLIVGSGEELTFTVAHLYQNWGRFPLKQIDSIQFYTPFYHMSCGVTETNCLRPYYEINFVKTTTNIYCLPDHRAMSAPLWTEFKNKDPQHTNGGMHNMLEYFADGKYITTEFVDDCITSYGPTYSEIVMDYVTDDGKIKVSYTHMEMPQTDENRGFYTCTYEFLDDLTVTDSKKNFSFYSVTGRYVDYGKLGYLNENNESVIVDNTLKGEAYYTLGDECPYFDCFKWMPTSEHPETENDYVNVSCLVYNYDIMVGGAAFTEGFGLYVQDGWAHLTLDADELSFKKGDKITINMIVIPWGSQLSDYTREDADWNVREVRNNTLLDPLTIEAISGEVIESPFLPKIKSADGNKAEFTLSGGENNATVEIYGMTSIARPVIYEKIDGEWQEYVISSKDTPDSRGNAHEYDGYMIRYEGDGTFSYSFVVDMNGDATRTFKVVVE